MTGLGRRTFLLGAAAAIAAPTSLHAASRAERAVAAFAGARTLAGSFVQFGPRGEQSEGSFAIERPGKAAFEFHPPSSLRMVADGRTVAVNNAALGTWDLYPLSRTPLRMLLGSRISLGDPMVRDVREGDGSITVTLADRQAFGDAHVEVAFDSASLALRQWKVVDAQGRETTVVVHGIRSGMSFPASRFAIPYSEIRSIR